MEDNQDSAKVEEKGGSEDLKAAGGVYGCRRKGWTARVGLRMVSSVTPRIHFQK